MFRRTAVWFSLLAVSAFAQDRPKELFQDACTACHTLSRVKSQQLSKDDWRGLIKGMLDEGFAVSDDEFVMLVYYLAKNFGEKPAGMKAEVKNAEEKRDSQ